MSLLSLRNIHKSYLRGSSLSAVGAKNRFPVLNGIDLDIEPGCCLGLLGRSGSGKSTLGRIALGLERPDKGMVLYQGQAIDSLRKNEYRNFRRNVQVVFQNSLGSVNPRFRVGQIIAEPINNFEAVPAAQLTEKISLLLGRVGLDAQSTIRKFPHQLSGGELQRVCIARAIALEPRLIVLDEAVSSLDMLLQTRILDLLGNIRRELRTAFLFISHDLRILLRAASRLVVMHQGCIVEHLADLNRLDRIAHPACQELFDAALAPLPTGDQSLVGDTSL